MSSSRRLVAWGLALVVVVPPRTWGQTQPAPEGPVAPESGAVPVPRGAGDKRRTVRSYPENLGYNLIGVVTRGNWGPLVAGAGLTASALVLDDALVDYFADHHYPWLADAGHAAGGGFVVASLTVGFFSAGRMVRGNRFRSATYDLSQAIIVNGAWTFALKAAAQRERPNGSNRHSFPSGHASNAFASATVLSRYYGLKVAIPAYSVAGLIGFSRMARNAHYFSDVVAGAAFGYGVGRAVVRRNSRPPTRPGDPTPPTPEDPVKVDLWPDAGPAGDGVGLALSIRF